jgi:hypothetical protein
MNLRTVIGWKNSSIIQRIGDIYRLAPTSFRNGTSLYIKNIDIYDVTILPAYSQTIDGLNSIVLKPEESLEIFIDNNNWKILNSSSGSSAMTGNQIRSALGITTLTGSNTGDQDISGKVDKVTGSSLVADTEIAKIHASGSDNQDLTGLQPKETGKGLSTNDYTTAEQAKLSGIATGATVGADWNSNVTNKPTIPAAQVQTDWNASSGMGVLLNKPSTFSPTTHDNSAHSATYIVQANAVVPNGAITGATKTKLTYDAKGLVTSGTDATTADIADSTDKRYCTDAQKTVIGNTSGTNSGDSSGHSALAPLDNPSFTTKITTPAITLGSTALTSTGTEINLLHGITVLSGSNTGDNSANSSTMYIGTTAHALNRGSGAETIAGLTLTTPNIGAATGASVVLTGAITSSGTAGIGYASGAGGTQTQSSSRTTGVTLSKLCGTITMFSSAVAAAASSTFTWTNTLLAATDIVIMQHNSSTNACCWKIEVICGAGSATVVVKNISAGSITEATPLKFIVIKAVNA